MKMQKLMMDKRKKIALVAHDNKKDDMLGWVKYNQVTLSQHTLYATGTTGTILGKILDLEKNQKLLALDAMISGQEVERKRIAQDLHDGLGVFLRV